MDPQDRSPRVIGWLKDLQEAGPDEKAARAVYTKIRDDPNATQIEREHLYQCVAQQSVVWFLEALQGARLTDDDLRAEGDDQFGLFPGTVAAAGAETSTPKKKKRKKKS